jgi:hypothetical protein
MRVKNRERLGLGCIALLFLLFSVGMVLSYFKEPDIGTVIEQP